MKGSGRIPDVVIAGSGVIASTVFASVCPPVSHCEAVSYALSGFGSGTCILMQTGRSTCVESAKVNASMLAGPLNKAAKLPRRRAELLRGLSQLSSRAFKSQSGGWLRRIADSKFRLVVDQPGYCRFVCIFIRRR